jgi:hypothetical protein
MKGLKYASLILAFMPVYGFAELKVLNDQSMSSVTGQAGLTIEIEAMSVKIGEINYKDEGNLYLSDIALGGAGLAQAKRGMAVTKGSLLDNIIMTIDVAGDAADSASLESHWGLGKISGPAMVVSPLTVGDHGETAIAISDGDLVIGIGANDQAEMVDFGAYTDRVSLGASTLGAGEGMAGAGTVLASNLVVQGYVGPIDIVISGSSNVMNINSYIEAEGEATLDFMATSFEFKFHNQRGADVLIYDNLSTGEKVSFFHAQADIGAAVNPADGLRVNLTDASGDIDLTNIVFGSAPTIGDVYLTDLVIQADLNIYGH